MTALPPWTSADFADAFQRHLPTGPIWPRDPDTTQRAAIEALMPTYQRSWSLACDLPAETFPASCVSLLSEWEASLGLPDPCAGPDPTIAQRQAHVVARLTQQNGPSIPSLVAFASALLPNLVQPLLSDTGEVLLSDDGESLLSDGDTAISITEFAPSRLGVFRLGQRMQSARWAHVWQITAPATVITSFRLGQGRLGERFRSWGSHALECEMQRLKPAHTILLFAYGGASSAAPLDEFVLGRDVLTP